MVVNGLILFVSGVPGIPKINNFNVELGIQQYILAFDIAVRDSFRIYIFESFDDLFKDGSCHFF